MPIYKQTIRRLPNSLLALLISGLLISLASVWSHAAPVNASNKAIYITIDGAIGPASKDYFIRSLHKAEQRQARLFIVQINTPGGLDTSMRDMIQAILASPIPVVTYVAPSGARAASAGTYILYASHIAAMAPATNLGAATPVQIGGIETPAPPETQPDNNKGNQKNNDKGTPNNIPSDNKSTLARKMTNDAVAYIQGLAELRGRNRQWAEKAVREAASLSASDALKQHVVDLIATDMSDLLKQLDERRVKTQHGELQLHTQGMVLESIEPDWRNHLLSIITDPNVAYIFMLIGIYGLIFEFSNPGAVVPGIVGAICLLLALFAFQALPINYAGFALILLGVIFMVAEAFAPSFGALGIGGVVAFVIGSVILIDTDVPGFDISVILIGSIALVSSILFTLVLMMAIKARRRPVVSGQEQLIGAVGEALQDFDQHGYVFVHSERWNATSDAPVTKGQKLKVIKMDGLNLIVKPLPADHQENKS